MEKNSKTKQKGAESEYLIFGKSESEERNYKSKDTGNREINERIEKWKEQRNVKLGKIAGLVFELERA